jgi:hypothetical protein
LDLLTLYGLRERQSSLRALKAVARAVPVRPAELSVT